MRIAIGQGLGFVKKLPPKYTTKITAISSRSSSQGKNLSFNDYWKKIRVDFFKRTPENLRELLLRTDIEKNKEKELDLSFLNPIVLAVTEQAIKEAKSPKELCDMLPNYQESMLTLPWFAHLKKTLLPIDIDLIFCKFPVLENLNLSNTNLSENIETIGQLCDHLAINTKLKNINLSGNMLSADAFNLIFSALIHNNSVKIADLSRNFPLRKSLTMFDEERSYLSPCTNSLKRMLQSNKCLENLDLRFCKLGKALRPGDESPSYFIESLVEGLKNNKTIKIINLKGTDLEVPDKELLKKHFKENSNNSKLEILL